MQVNTNSHAKRTDYQQPWQEPARGSLPFCPVLAKWADLDVPPANHDIHATSHNRLKIMTILWSPAPQYLRHLSKLLTCHKLLVMTRLSASTLGCTAVVAVVVLGLVVIIWHPTPSGHGPFSVVKGPLTTLERLETSIESLIICCFAIVMPRNESCNALFSSAYFSGIPEHRVYTSDIQAAFCLRTC